MLNAPVVDVCEPSAVVVACRQGEDCSYNE